MASKKTEKNLIVGLDIGTSKIAAMVGEVDAEGRIEIIGLGTYASRGLKKGVVVNIESTIQGISRAVEEAELMAGCQIHSAYTGIAGNHVRSINSHGIVAIKDSEVLHADVERVIEAAKAVAIPADQQIIHVLPQEFIIDNQGGIREPVGMSGVRLESRVHMVMGSVSVAQNIVKCVQRCGLEVADVVLDQLASSQAVLSDDERELGVCLVDIGGGTTDIVIFSDNAIRHTAVIPIAGDQVTNDIACALRTPTQAAEDIKVRHGRAISKLVDANEMIEVSAVAERSGRKISARLLAEVIEARYEELFKLIAQEIKRCGFEDRISAGIVLTGGAAILPEVIALAESVFKMPVRLGVPRSVAGLENVISNPAYATGVGLLMYGLQQQNKRRTDRVLGTGVKGVWGRMRNWVQGNF